jgi:hypothetical protein
MYTQPIKMITFETVKLNLFLKGWRFEYDPKTACHRDFIPAKNAHILTGGTGLSAPGRNGFTSPC